MILFVNLSWNRTIPKIWNSFSLDLCDEATVEPSTMCVLEARPQGWNQALVHENTAYRHPNSFAPVKGGCYGTGWQQLQNERMRAKDIVKTRKGFR